MTRTEDTRRLPELAVVLLAIGALALWILAIGLFLLVVLSLDPAFSRAGLLEGFNALPDDPMLATAMGAQMAATILVLLVFWVMSSLIVVLHYGGQPAQALRAALLLLRIFMGLIILRFIASMLLPYAVSPGIISILQVLAPGLPQLAVELAFLICADRYLAARSAPAAA